MTTATVETYTSKNERSSSNCDNNHHDSGQNHRNCNRNYNRKTATELTHVLSAYRVCKSRVDADIYRLSDPPLLVEAPANDFFRGGWQRRGGGKLSIRKDRGLGR